MSRPFPAWMLLSGALVLIGITLTALANLGGAALPERTGAPVEELAVERTVLTPGAITVTVRNTGPDPVQVAQVAVNDAYVDVTGGTEAIDRLGTAVLTLHSPWQTGQPYLVSLLTSTGVVIEHLIPAAAPTPAPDAEFFGLMTLLGSYVGVVPVLLGMTVLPALRRAGGAVVRVLLAVTVGLLGFLAVDAVLEGIELAERAGGGFGGPVLVLLGAVLAYLVLAALDRVLTRRRTPDSPDSPDSPDGLRLAVLIAIGIGLHNLGEGLAIGSAYAIGELALGAALVVGFALHNTTEGLAVVAPLTRRPTGPVPLIGLGLLAGAPAILGAVLGATVDNAALAAFLLGVGAGAVVQVVVQILPALRRSTERAAEPAVLGGVAAGVLIMYATGLLVAA